MTLIKKLRAFVDADEKIQETKFFRDLGGIVHRSRWKGVYSAREKAERELWGTCADDRAEIARAILRLLDGR